MTYWSIIFLGKNISLFRKNKCHFKSFFKRNIEKYIVKWIKLQITNVCWQKSESQSPPRKYDRDSAGGRNSPKKKKNVLRRPARDSDTDSLHSVRSEPNLSARSDSSSSSSSYAKNDVFRKVSVGQGQAKMKK